MNHTMNIYLMTTELIATVYTLPGLWIVANGVRAHYDGETGIDCHGAVSVPGCDRVVALHGEIRIDDVLEITGGPL